MNVKEMGWDNNDWIHVVQDKEKFWAHVNMVINLYVPELHKMWDISLAEALLALQEGRCSL